NTFWAPEIVYDPDEKLYHMYVSYIVGVYTDWLGKSSIEHYTSSDLFYWDHVGGLSFGSGRIIDPCCIRLPDGTWRMWYKDECQNSFTHYADSKDLYNWEYRGNATTDPQEGPNVFEFEGKYWLIADVHGQAVYSSDDGEHFVRQKTNILDKPGTRREDNIYGAHADVFVIGGRAFIVYFTHPDCNRPNRTVVQMAELKVIDGILTCDRDAEVDCDWSQL
ncbi:MAG: glycosyl hydrolase, partial [Clostridia bacterium]|nr:glycosyl hydrolase [Clostridia bacterium]